MRTIHLEEAAKLLAANDNILILTHKRADGDTCGSAAALCLLLRALGKTAYVQKNSESTVRFQGMMQPFLPPEGFEPSFVATTDVASKTLLPADAVPYADRIDLCIDHHRTGGLGENVLLDPSAAATGEIILRLCDAMGVALDQKIAEMAYMAIVTDTGRFKYPSTTSDTLRLAARCYDAGADTVTINRLFFDTKTKSRLRMEGYVYENLRFSQNGRMAMCVITRAVMKEFGITGDDMDNISALPMQAEGVDMALTLIENLDGTLRLSVRASVGVDAAEFCGRYGGGGHQGASGAHLEGKPTEEFAEMLFSAAEKYVNGA